MSERSKVMVEVDDGAYVDPMHVVSVRSVSFGTWGVVRIKTDDGDTFDIRRHPTESHDQPDPEPARDVIEKLMQGAVAASR